MKSSSIHHAKCARYWLLLTMLLLSSFQLFLIFPAMLTWDCDPNAARKQHVESPSKGTSSPVTTVLPKFERLIKPLPRNQTAAICAVAKDEEPYIDEWLDFHLGIGFGPIYIFDNSDNHDMKHLADKRQRIFGDPVVAIHDPGPGRQKHAYKLCAKLARDHNHMWAAFIDVDEFVVIKNRTRYPHIVDLLKEYAKSGRLHIWWRNFGSSGNEVYEPIPVTKRFQHLVQKEHRNNHQYKTIVHLPDFDFARNITTPHFLHVKRGSAVKDTTGAYPNRKSVGPDDVIALYHYQWKSFGELVKHKRARGDSWWGINKHFIRTAHNRQTQDGLPLPNGTTFDDTAWQILKSVAPRYSVYDAFDVHSRSDFVPDKYNKTLALLHKV